MSKSLGNFYKVEDVEEKGFSPMALRYYYLTTHYRKTMNFTWEGLMAAQTAWEKLNGMVLELKGEMEGAGYSEEGEPYYGGFVRAIEDDLNTPQALAVVWEMMKSGISDEAKKNLVVVFDSVLGLQLGTEVEERKREITPKIRELLETREKLREMKKWAEADAIRDKVEKMGYKVEDK